MRRKAWPVVSKVEHPCLNRPVVSEAKFGDTVQLCLVQWLDGWENVCMRVCIMKAIGGEILTALRV